MPACQRIIHQSWGNVEVKMQLALDRAGKYHSDLPAMSQGISTAPRDARPCLLPPARACTAKHWLRCMIWAVDCQGVSRKQEGMQKRSPILPPCMSTARQPNLLVTAPQGSRQHANWMPACDAPGVPHQPTCLLTAHLLPVCRLFATTCTTDGHPSQNCRSYLRRHLPARPSPASPPTSDTQSTSDTS
jgi:hypothetical protein